MKALAYLLAFANVAFLGWSLLIGEPAREPPLPARGPAVPTLKLAVESSAPTKAGAPPVAGSRCVTVGPFLDETQAERASQLLHAEKLAPRLRHEDTSAGTSFEVTLVAASTAEAAHTAMRLKGAGIKDVEVRDASLALGKYPSHEAAEARTTALRKLGIDPAINEAPRTIAAHWLDVDLGPRDHPVDVAAIQATVGGGAALSLKPCATTVPAGATDPAPAPDRTSTDSPPADGDSKDERQAVHEAKAAA